jgi:hypothetical protein
VYPQHTHQGATADSMSSIEFKGPRIPIYSAEFAADPHGFYRQIRSDYGPLVPVEMWPGVSAAFPVVFPPSSPLYL